MEKVLLQFRHKGKPPDLLEAATLFGLSEADIDADYGVIATDPEAGLYSMLINETASRKVQAVFDARGAASDEGLFSNVRIEPTGNEY
jgi:hypothetical protein